MSFDGQGTTVTFGTSTNTFNIISVGEIGQEVDDIDTSHLGTTGAKTYIPADLPESGEVQFVVEHDPTQEVAVPGVVETINVDFGGQAKPLGGNGYIKAYKVNGAETGQRVTASLTVKLSGALTQITA